MKGNLRTPKETTQSIQKSNDAKTDLNNSNNLNGTSVRYISNKNLLDAKNTNSVSKVISQFRKHIELSNNNSKQQKNILKNGSSHKSILLTNKKTANITSFKTIRPAVSQRKSSDKFINHSKDLLNKFSNLKIRNGDKMNKPIRTQGMENKNNDVEEEDFNVLYGNKNSNEFINTKKFSIKDFELISTLGKGKFGNVYLAREKKMNYIIALKILNKSEIQKMNGERMIVREIKIQSFLKHPNIIDMYGFFDDDENIYFILEYASEGTIYDLLKKQVG